MSNNIFCTSFLRIRCALLCTTLFISCQSAPEIAKQKLAQDKQATAQLSQINSSVNEMRMISPGDFETLKNLRTEYPESAEIRQTYKKALILRKDWEALEGLLKESLFAELSPEDQILLARANYSLGKYQSVIDVLQPVSDTGNVDLQIKSLLGQAYLNLGRVKEAAEQLDSVWDKIVAEKKADEITARGIIYYHQNDLTKAAETLNKALEIKPDNAMATHALGRVYAQQGEMEKAEEYRAKTVDIHNAVSAAELEGSRTVMQVRELENAWKAKRYDEVIDVSRRMINPTTTRDQKIILYQYIFESYKALGRQSEAQGSLTEIQKLQQQK